MKVIPRKYQLKFSSEVGRDKVRRFFITDYTYYDTPTVREVSRGVFALEMEKYMNRMMAIYGIKGEWSYD